MLCTLIALAVACSAAPELPAQNTLYDPNSGYADIVLLNSPVNPDRTEKSTPTLDKMATIDFVAHSTTGLTHESMTREEIDERISPYGRFDGRPGMPYDEYREAMEYVWLNATDYARKPSAVAVDITKAYRYNDLVAIMKDLSCYEGVSLYDIGVSAEGRAIYALEVDVPSSKKKNTVVLTGSIHSRETAGAVFLLKELAELLSAGTRESKEVLATTRFAVVPCCNPDGREAVCFDAKKYTMSDGQYWKATTDGTDLNRNFPGLVWSQVANGNKKIATVASAPRPANYPGDHAGCAPETKALMKFLYYYIGVEKSRILIDYHQQGALSYSGKPWSTVRQQALCRELTDRMLSVLNSGNRHKYIWVSETADYGLNGTGSTLTDYASSVAYGAKFSPGFGFCVYADGKDEYPLCAVPHADDSKFRIVEAVPGFRTMTFEIGYGRQYLGYGPETRKLLADEYYSHHFDRVLYEVAKYCQGVR